MRCFVGTSGWQYYHWKGGFYPEELKPSEFLSFYSTKFNSVEVNSSFYHFTKPSTFMKWKSVRRGFTFSVKMNKEFTHVKRLRMDDESMGRLNTFLENCRILDDRLGVVLIQLPPSLKRDNNLLESFMSNLPDMKFAVEFRHESWLNPETYRVLEKYSTAFVISDSPRWKTDFVKTSDFSYIRFHGKPRIFASKYDDKELERFSRIVSDLSPNELYAYFNNDALGHAPFDAMRFRDMLGCS